MADRVPYLVKKNGVGGALYYWQPNKTLRRRGFLPEPLGSNFLAAQRRAQQINESVAENRTPLPGDDLPERSSQPRRGVYVIGLQRGPVKIGIARNPVKRLNQLRTASAEALELFFFLQLRGIDARRVERAVHAEMVKKRKNGEWFDCTPEDAARIIHARVAFFLRSGVPTQGVVPQLEYELEGEKPNAS